MRGKKGDSNATVLAEPDLRNELSTLVDQNIIPSRIADKVENKLKEKNVKITKEQLHTLVFKIRDLMSSYTKSGLTTRQPEMTSVGQPIWGESDTDMQQLVETVEQLKERITTIEQKGLEGMRGAGFKAVTTKDIRTMGKIDEPLREEDLYPLLEIPNDPESVVVLMKWLQYLVDKIGKTHLPDVLGYYVDIGWISDDVRLDLIKYSKGITEEITETATRKKSPHLPTRDHLQSLLYIQKLKGTQLDERFICRVEREMEKMAKSLENYPFK